MFGFRKVVNVALMTLFLCSCSSEHVYTLFPTSECNFNLYVDLANEPLEKIEIPEDEVLEFMEKQIDETLLGFYEGYYIYANLRHVGNSSRIINCIDGYFFDSTLWDWKDSKGKYKSSNLLCSKKEINLYEELSKEFNDDIWSFDELYRSGKISSSTLKTVHNEFWYDYVKRYGYIHTGWFSGVDLAHYNVKWSSYLNNMECTSRNEDGILDINGVVYSQKAPRSIPKTHYIYNNLCPDCYFIRDIDLNNVIYFGKYKDFEIFAEIKDINPDKIAYYDTLYIAGNSTYEKDWYFDYSSLFMNYYYFGDFHYDIFAYRKGCTFYLPSLKRYLSMEFLEKLAKQIYQYQLDNYLLINGNIVDFKTNYINKWNYNYKGFNIDTVRENYLSSKRKLLMS